MPKAQLAGQPAWAALAWRSRLGLTLQREIGRLLGPIWIPLSAGLMRFWLGYRIQRVTRSRRAYRQIRREHRGPLLICANHLTLIDSALIAWALGSPCWYLWHFSALPWNLPEQQNFAWSWPSRTLSYLMKCLPITRGGAREDVAHTLARFTAVLAHGEVGLIFLEGGRSRTGRVDVEAITYGVGRIVNALPGCRVLCVYLRGTRQATFSDVPARGERFHVALELIEPRSSASGLRADRDVARQIVGQLVTLEQRYFDDRE